MGSFINTVDHMFKGHAYVLIYNMDIINESNNLICFDIDCGIGSELFWCGRPRIWRYIAYVDICGGEVTIIQSEPKYNDAINGIDILSDLFPKGLLSPYIMKLFDNRIEHSMIHVSIDDAKIQYRFDQDVEWISDEHIENNEDTEERKRKVHQIQSDLEHANITMFGQSDYDGEI